MTENKPKKLLTATNIALIAVWTALLLACSFIPAYPILGTGAQITFSNILHSSLTAPLLGPILGTISGFILGWVIPYVNPATSIGLLTFLAPTVAALISGLVLFNRWKEATLILAVEVAVWMANPFAWYELMPVVMWQFIPVAIFIIVPPVRKFIINSIATLNVKRLPIALFCLAFVARIGGDVATGNNIAIWVLGWGGPDMYIYWAPVTIYYAIADTLNCVIGGILGSAVLIAIFRSGLKVPGLEYVRSKLMPKPVK
jgi:hypothetical protein